MPGMEPPSHLLQGLHTFMDRPREPNQGFCVPGQEERGSALENTSIFKHFHVLTGKRGRLEDAECIPDGPEIGRGVGVNCCPPTSSPSERGETLG